MRAVSFEQAKRNFYAYVAEVEVGERIVIVRDGIPVAEIVPVSKTTSDVNDID